MTGLIIAWLAGDSIIVYRSLRAGQPPVPGDLLKAQGLFVLLAVLAEWAPGLATALGAGVDVAALMNLWGTGGPAGTLPPKPSNPLGKAHP